MTLAEIMHLALRQLDEDPADVSDHDDVMRVYANEGYQNVMRDVYRPRYTVTLETDGSGAASLRGMKIIRIAALCDEQGRPAAYVLSPDGQSIRTNVRHAELAATVETEHPPLTQGTDEPKFPQWAHSVLADYICYRHLSGGSLVKQQRAQFFLKRFWVNARRIRPQGMGSAVRLTGLNTETDVRREA